MLNNLITVSNLLLANLNPNRHLNITDLAYLFDGLPLTCTNLVNFLLTRVDLTDYTQLPPDYHMMNDSLFDSVR